MTNLKKIFFLFSFFLISLGFAKNFSFSIEPFFQLNFGKMGEYIYASSDNSKVASELTWNINPILETGISLDGKWKYFGFSTSFFFGFPMKSGSMTDCDFLLDGTKYSNAKFDEKLKNDLNGNMSLYGIFTLKNLIISPILDVFYNYISFEGYNGICWYGGNDLVAWNDPKATYYGLGKVGNINYERHSLYTFLGIKAEYKFISKFSLYGAFYISPYTYTSAMDDHLKIRSSSIAYSFQEIQHSWWTRFKWEIGSTINFTKRIGINIIISGLHGLTDKGELLTNMDRKHFFTVKDQKSGADILNITTRIGLKILF